MTNRELDILVAKTVMGWKDVREGNFPGYDWIGKKPLSNGENSRGDYWIPCYSTDITDAWQIIERVRSLGWRFEISDTSNVSWWVRFGKGKFDQYENGWSEEYIADEKSPSLAICLAALRTVKELDVTNTPTAPLKNLEPFNRQVDAILARYGLDTPGWAMLASDLADLIDTFQ